MCIHGGVGGRGLSNAKLIHEQSLRQFCGACIGIWISQLEYVLFEFDIILIQIIQTLLLVVSKSIQIYMYRPLIAVINAITQTHLNFMMSVFWTQQIDVLVNSFLFYRVPSSS